MSPNVFLVPGQSSADPGAIARARRAHPAAERLADEAAAVLGPADAARYLGGDEAPLTTNRDVQIVVFLASQMYLRALDDEGVTAAASLGLSLGEYSHLVHIGALPFADALRLVSERGRCYDEAPQGVMVTVLGVDKDTVAEAVAGASGHGTVVISNFNTPTQHVLAGHDDAVTWAASALDEAYGAHTVVIEPHVPMHSPLMVGVALTFGRHLAGAPWQRPVLAYRPNVVGTPLAPAKLDGATFVDLLTRHVSEPVRWDVSMDTVAGEFPEACYVEVGPGGVLTNMIGRSWKRLARARMDAPDAGDPKRHLEATLEALCARA
jgi:[acyl-carrier-protein] S-malonyltransferase